MNHPANHQDWEPVVFKKPAHLVPGAKKGGGGGPTTPPPGGGGGGGNLTSSFLNIGTGN